MQPTIAAIAPHILPDRAAGSARVSAARQFTAATAKNRCYSLAETPHQTGSDLLGKAAI
jgi:hypothetical protein